MSERPGSGLHGIRCTIGNVGGTDISDPLRRDRFAETSLAVSPHYFVEATRRNSAQMQIALAPADRQAQAAGALHDTYVEDALRRDVVRHLLPSARVTLAGRKAELPHHRHLTITLRDARRVTILLDQGFGAWRSESFVRHDFGKDARAQARTIASLNVGLRSLDPRGTPMTIDIGLPNIVN